MSAKPQLAGVIGFFDNPTDLLAATAKTRDAKWQSFDVFSPFPVHGMDEAQGLKRSWIPYVTMIMGIVGCVLGFSLEYWTSAVDWPINIGGKPFNSWPAFVPVMFELTVLLAALSSVATMFIVNGLPNITKKIYDPSLTRDRFAIVIDAPKKSSGHGDDDEEEKPLAEGVRAFHEAQAAEFLKQLGAKDVRSVYAEGWF